MEESKEKEEKGKDMGNMKRRVPNGNKREEKGKGRKRGKARKVKWNGKVRGIPILNL